MKIVKHIVIGLILFSVSFSLMFFLSDKTEYHKVDNYVIEPRVYVTNYGDCYHAYGCHYLSQSMIAKGIREAELKGYRACSYCGGIPHGTIEVNYYITETKDVTDEAIIKSVVFAPVIVVVYTSFFVVFIFITKTNTKKAERGRYAKPGDWY